jgi:hypothetical protein
VTSARKERLADMLLGSIVGALFTGVITASTLYVEVKLLNSRVARLEVQLAEVTQVTLREDRKMSPMGEQFK